MSILRRYPNYAAAAAGLGQSAAAAAQAAAAEVAIEMFYMYLATISLLASASATPSIILDADSDFMVIWLIASSTGAFSFRMTDNATGRVFSNAKVNNVNIFGTAQLPFPMLPPYTFKRQNSIGLDVTDLSAAPNVIQIVLAGKKIFPSATAGAAAPVEAAA